MAAPATTARATPLGIKLFDGYSSKVAHASDSDISLWEVTVQPPGLDTGDAIDITTMHNTTYRTLYPPQLITVTEMNFTCLYDPDAYDEIIAIMRINTSITVHFSDTSGLNFFGFIKSFEPDSMEGGTAPNATVTIVPTNYDSTNDVEAAPVMNEAATT